MVDVNEYWEHDNKLRKQNGTRREFASVVRLSDAGEPVIVFMGETLASGKIYPYFKSYLPAIGDRVMLIDGVIIGGWRGA